MSATNLRSSVPPLVPPEVWLRPIWHRAGHTRRWQFGAWHLLAPGQAAKVAWAHDHRPSSGVAFEQRMYGFNRPYPQAVCGYRQAYDSGFQLLAPDAIDPDDQVCTRCLTSQTRR
jgi:hypothetical protein